MNLSVVDDAIASRMSVRAFTNQPVPRGLLEKILQVASRAPSGTNCQPWHVYVLQGTSRDALVEQVCTIHDAMRADPALVAEYAEEYDYYPQKWVSPYIDRRRENGWGLYGLMGIGKGDKDKMHLQHQRNYRFFDAPVGLMFTVDRAMGRGSLLDYGCFLQSIMVARVGMVCTPAHRRLGTGFPRSSCRTSARARMRCWSVAWRWVTRMRRPLSTPFTRRVFQFKISRLGWVEVHGLSHALAHLQ